MNTLNQSILKPFLDAILAERDWSWSFICILYLLCGMVIRGWFLGALTSRTRDLDKKLRHAVKKSYLKRSLPGWIFFFIPLAILIVLWQDRPLPVKVERVHLLGAAIASYILSIILHLRAFGASALLTLKRLSESEQQKKFLEG